MRKLLALFVEHVKAEHNGDNGDGNRGGGGRSGACAMLRLELAVPENLMRLGKAAMQRLVNELGTGHQGRQMIRNGVRYRLNGYRSKTVHGCMRCSRCCAPTTPVAWGRGWRHRMSGRGSRTGTPSACEYHVAQFVGNNPYQRSRDHFHQIFRPDGVARISLHKIEQMVDALGPRMEDQRQEEIAARSPEGRPLATEDEITDTMVVCIDGRNAPTKDNERIDDDKGRRYVREFREVKVASVSALEGDEVDQRRAIATAPTCWASSMPTSSSSVSGWR